MANPEIPKRLLELLGDVFNKPSAFYRARLLSLGVETVEQLAEAWLRMPPTERGELIADQLAHLPHGSRHLADAAAPVRAGACGSADALLVLTWTAADLARERAAGVRSLRAAGVRPGMRVANALPGALYTPGSLLFGDVVDELGALDIPLGEVTDARSAAAAWKLMERVQPNILALRPADSAVLFDAAPASAGTWLEGILWMRSTAEVSRSAATAPSLSARQGTWLAIPEAACFAATQRPCGAFHADDDVFVEFLDAAGQPGASGTFAVTPLGRENVLLRYATGDSARTVACGCTALGFVLGAPEPGREG